MSANSVSAPHDGMTRPESSEYFAGTGRNELSECHNRSPSLKNHTRSSADMILPSLSRLEKSAMPAPSRLSSPFRDGPAGRVFLNLAERAGEGELLLAGDVRPGNTSTAYRS